LRSAWKRALNVGSLLLVFATATCVVSVDNSEVVAVVGNVLGVEAVTIGVVRVSETVVPGEEGEEDGGSKIDVIMSEGLVCVALIIDSSREADQVEGIEGSTVSVETAAEKEDSSGIVKDSMGSV
jgi:hypothetical protein